LDELGEPYATQVRISRWVPDFVLEHRRIVLEADGRYWHARPEVAAKDARKDADLARLGYRVVHLREDAIRTDPVAAVLAALADA
jgi:very-short-patch-repair endonuclease